MTNPRQFTLPAMLDAPAALLQDLRAIDPQADLLYVGAGHWLLACWPERSSMPDGGAARRLDGIRMVLEARRTAHTPWNLLRTGLLAAHGAVQIVLYEPGYGGPARSQLLGGPDSSIVHDFRERHWQWMHNRKEFTAPIQQLLVDERTWRAREARRQAEQIGRQDKKMLEEIHRFAFRHPTSVTTFPRQERVA